MVSFKSSLPPPKVEGGYVFTHQLVCEQDISKSYGRMWTKIDEQVGCVPRANRLDLGEDLDPDAGIFKVIL